MTTHRIAVAAALFVSLFVLSACSTMKVVGRVVTGEISHVGVVDGSDSRLKTNGLDGIEVTISQASGGGSNSMIGRAVTTGGGHFSIKVDASAWPTDRVQVRATGDFYATARGLVFLPRDGQQLLILMERTAGD
jgi:predicted small secreted protein